MLLGILICTWLLLTALAGWSLYRTVRGSVGSPAPARWAGALTVLAAAVTAFTRGHDGSDRMVVAAAVATAVSVALALRDSQAVMARAVLVVAGWVWTSAALASAFEGWSVVPLGLLGAATWMVGVLPVTRRCTPLPQPRTRTTTSTNDDDWGSGTDPVRFELTSSTAERNFAGEDDW